MDKRTLLAKLDGLYDKVEQKEAIYREYSEKSDYISRQISDLNRVKLSQRIIGAVIAYALFWGVMFLGDVFYVPEAAEQPFIMQALVYMELAIIILAVLVQVFMKKIVTSTKSYKNKMALLKEEEKQLKKEYFPIIFAKAEEGIDIFPELGKEYHTTQALQRMISYVESGRADTVKEIIETYERDCHRERIERAQERIMAELEAQQAEIQSLSCKVSSLAYRS